MTALYRKITLRIVPYLMLLYMVAFLDRVNISFAALTMNRDLGISESFYGFAAGVFFIGYCLFEVPANLMLARIGARRWLAVLMIAWGVISIGTAFVDSRAQYIAARSLLGVAESGFFPGLIFYLTLWLPRPMRTRVMALFLLSLPLCNCIGSPISSHVLLLAGLGGLKGWQWLFILEASPAIVLGVVTWLILADHPATARWLTAEEKDRLSQAMHSDDSAESGERGRIGLHVARDAIAYLAMQIGVYGINFWLPKILASEGVSTGATGWWAMLPYGAGAVAMVAVSRASGRRWLAALYLAGAMGMAWAGVAHDLGRSVAALSLATMAMYASLPLFWSVTTAGMSAKVAGPAIATVNCIGVMGGFAGPYAIGWLLEKTHSYAAGMGAIAACLVIGALIAVVPVSRVAPVSIG